MTFSLKLVDREQSGPIEASVEGDDSGFPRRAVPGRALTRPISTQALPNALLRSIHRG
jgi:hypothetical protein